MNGPILALVLLLATSSTAAAAQEPTTAGFLFAYDPGSRESFEPGYRRHLAWHRERHDSLSWLGWDVVVGDRPGAFVDGVFGVPFAALDARVDPAGDRADAAANVLPHATPLSREILALRPDLGTAAPLEEGAPTPLVEVVWYAAGPTGLPALEAALRTLRGSGSPGSPGSAGSPGAPGSAPSPAVPGSRAPLLPYTVYERVAGAEAGFVLMVWRDRMASFDRHDGNPVRLLQRLLAERRAAGGPTADGPTDTTLRSTSEVWLYRPDLTYLAPEEAQ